MIDRRDLSITKLVNIFSSITASISIDRTLEPYVKNIDSSRRQNKRDLIRSLIETYGDNPEEFKYIIKEILRTHGYTWKSEINTINDSLSFFGLRVNPETEEIEQISPQSIDNIVTEFSNSSLCEFRKLLIPSDILDNGKKMANAYLIIYCIENTLRYFIDSVCERKFGPKYWTNLNITRDIDRKLTIRKQESQRNQFHSNRGDKEMFYIDLEDLQSLIEQNWELFKEYLPDQDFLRSRISDITVTRNQIAHNSIISKDDQIRISLYYKDILGQLSS